MNISRLRHSTWALILAGLAGLSLAAGCFSSEPRERHSTRPEARAEAHGEAAKPIASSPALPAGQYEIQSATYDDATGVYKIFVLNAPAGYKPLFESQDVRMARLDDAAIAAGKKSHIEFKEDEASPALYLTSDFQIAFVHNITEERVSESGQREMVVVRQETTSWSPFVSAMAGAAVGNMLFAPRYYYPPPYYGGGGALIGFGGAGHSRALASSDYSNRFGHEPKPARFSKSGMTPRKVSPTSLKPSGSGAGSSRFNKPSGSSRPSRPGVSFGRRR